MKLPPYRKVVSAERCGENERRTRTTGPGWRLTLSCGHVTVRLDASTTRLSPVAARLHGPPDRLGCTECKNQGVK